ncbi:hypothetical protein JOB18_007688 [Solea senegalensis]|uniref:Uncharacterized protein n=1 Tax=Solea senegalensis TaxID=28829 RepID=A0AAV6QRA3_SOLSE|nr:hypothetical protein JOB18_007688 [Solea senegalensis]
MNGRQQRSKDDRKLKTQCDFNIKVNGNPEKRSDKALPFCRVCTEVFKSQDNKRFTSTIFPPTLSQDSRRRERRHRADNAAHVCLRVRPCHHIGGTCASVYRLSVYILPVNAANEQTMTGPQTCRQQCHGSSCCACGDGTSVNALPRSGIAVGTYGAASLSCPDMDSPTRRLKLNQLHYTLLEWRIFAFKASYPQAKLNYHRHLTIITLTKEQRQFSARRSPGTTGTYKHGELGPNQFSQTAPSLASTDVHTRCSFAYELKLFFFVSDDNCGSTPSRGVFVKLRLHNAKHIYPANGHSYRVIQTFKFRKRKKEIDSGKSCCGITWLQPHSNRKHHSGHRVFGTNVILSAACHVNVIPRQSGSVRFNVTYLQRAHSPPKPRSITHTHLTPFTRH